MFECDLDRDALETFSRGALGPDEEHRVEEHLRSGCLACQERVDAILLAFEAELDPVAAEEAAWDRLFARLERRLAEVAQERRAAPDLLAELLSLRPGEREALIRTGKRLQTLAVCELLIEESLTEGLAAPPRGAELAELALRLVDRLDTGHYGCSVVQDLRARAWAYLGNARRLGGDLAGAEEALGQAEALLDQGSADPLEEARILDLKASLLSDLGWFEKAAHLLAAAVAIYDDIHDPPRKGRALLGQGLALGFTGRAEEAVECLTRGLSLVAWEEEPRLVLQARLHLAWWLNDCGRVDDALHLLHRLRFCYGILDVWTELRLGWLESRIDWRRGREENAERGLREVCAGLLDQGFCYDATLALLDLAALYLWQGRNAAARRLAEEMLPAFLARDLERQAVDALVAFQEAVEAGGATPCLVGDLAAYLQRARRNPRLKLRGE